MRLAKYIAHNSRYSRRAAGDLINARKVTVDSRVAIDHSLLVTTGQVVRVAGEIIQQCDTTEIWKYNKPPEVLTTHNDPSKRPTIFDLMPQRMRAMIFIGRLDYNSEGLMLVTNNGDLANYLSSPRNKVERKYLVKCFGNVRTDQIDKMKGRTRIENTTYRVSECRIANQEKNDLTLELTLCEGKNREVRNIISYLGLKVKRLIRVSYGDIGIGKLPKGCIKKVDKSMVERYMRKAGLA